MGIESSKKPSSEIFSTGWNETITTIVDTSDDAIYSKTLDGIIVSWNKGAERIFGYREDEILGKHVSILTPADEPDEIPEILTRVSSGRRIDHYETIRKRKDGSSIAISLTISPIKDEKGKIVAASSIARDITDRARLHDTRNFLASIIDTSDDAILSKDLDGIILSWNQGAERLYGYTPEEVIGQHVSIIAPPELTDEIPNIMARLKMGIRINHYETVRVKKDGSRIHVSLSISPIKNMHGKVMAASAIARDITARKRGEEENARLVNELSRSLNEKNILLQEVYHRVKNNLQVISSLLDLRSRYALNDPAKTAAAFKESIKRIRAMALVHEKLYRTDDLERLDFGSYLRTLIEQLLHSHAINKRVKLKISGDLCEFDLNTAIPLALIFNELVMNTLKYAFKPAQKGTIEIHSSQDDKGIELRYSDDGIGLPDSVDLMTSDTFGFRIVRLLAKQLDAKIVVSSEKGTSFQIVIPKKTGGPNV